MTAQPPQDPYGQDPYGQQQGYGQSYQGYQQPYSGGYPQQARTPFDLAKFVFIAGYVVLGLYVVWFLYTIFNEDYGADFGDRFFNALTTLGQGVFYAAAVLAIGTWMQKQQNT